MVVPHGTVDRMADRHRHAPIGFRPPVGDRAWLLAHAAETERPVNAILAEALAAYRKRAERAKRRSGVPTA